MLGSRFKLVNDPGAWGSREPETLVLGITKGNTQSSWMAVAEKDRNEFDKVPFKNFRANLLRVLQSVGLATDEVDISRRIHEGETQFAWGSVVRCSLTGWDKRRSKFSGESGKVIPAFRPNALKGFVRNCVDQFLSDLPSRTKTVVLLGNSDEYIRLFRGVLRDQFSDFRPHERCRLVANWAQEKLWVHVGHPSPLNGHLNKFLDGSPHFGQGLKREMAKAAIAAQIYR